MVPGLCTICAMVMGAGVGPNRVAVTAGACVGPSSLPAGGGVTVKYVGGWFKPRSQGGDGEGVGKAWVEIVAVWGAARRYLKNTCRTNKRLVFSLGEQTSTDGCPQYKARTEPKHFRLDHFYL